MLASSKGRPWRISALISMPRPCLMSELIHPGGVQLPHPQLSRLMDVCMGLILVPFAFNPDLSAGRANLFQHRAKDFVGVKIIRSDLPGGARMPLVVCRDCLRAGD